MNVKELQPCGVEITGIDLSTGEYDDTVKEMFEKYGLLVFRDQKLDHEQQKRILAKCGPVLEDFRTVGYVSNTRADGILGDTEVSFHSDFNYTAHPALGISLHAIKVPYEETWTNFADGERGLAKLSPETRKRIENLKGLNIFSASEEGVKGRQTLEGYPEDAPRYSHSLVHTDPITKQKVLYACQQNTVRIEGVSEEEGEKLIEEFLEALYSPDNIYQHRWRDGDFVMWSNQKLHHARGGLVPGKERTLQRVVITDAEPHEYDAPIPEDRLPPSMRKGY